MDIGQSILQERLRRAFTQAELARRTGISQPNLSAIEKGRRDMTVSTLRQIALALGVPASVLLGERPDQTSQVLTRPRIERIAKFVVRAGVLGKDADERVAALFRQVLPAPRTKRRPAKKTLRSWLQLRAEFDPTQIRSILGRIEDESLRAA